MLPDQYSFQLVTITTCGVTLGMVVRNSGKPWRSKLIDCWPTRCSWTLTLPSSTGQSIRSLDYGIDLAMDTLANYNPAVAERHFNSVYIKMYGWNARLLQRKQISPEMVGIVHDVHHFLTFKVWGATRSIIIIAWCCPPQALKGSRRGQVHELRILWIRNRCSQCLVSFPVLICLINWFTTLSRRGHFI